MSFFIGSPAVEYPAFLVNFHTESNQYAFFVMNLNSDSAAIGASPALGAGAGSPSAQDAGLLSAITSYINTNGWYGNAVTSLTVTKYAESSSDVTP
jgi:hypothetical protein